MESLASWGPTLVTTLAVLVGGLVAFGRSTGHASAAQEDIRELIADVKRLTLSADRTANDLAHHLRECGQRSRELKGAIDRINARLDKEG